ncbi:MAG: glycoside hydrolase family 32 protein, partial [Bacteroidales bacterium]|nr:glycoside hydrolase family 32 protein [Bacteroidales bacterium]
VAISCSTKEQKGINNQQQRFSAEKYRPQFHFSPEAHWMNDPNGMVYYEGEYHLFYQYYPNATVWGPMHWGHAVSSDLVTWDHLPIALYPDSLGYIFSGSTVVDTANSSGLKIGDEDPLVALFTYSNPEWEKAGRNDYQYQGMAYSNDKGRTWEKYGVVISNPGQKDFRDPKVIWHEGSQKWIMTIVAGQHAEFYSSPDLKNWKKESEFGYEVGDHSGVWECPDLFPIKVKGSDETKWVLLVSVQPGNPPVQYFIGAFDGTTFTPDNTQSVPKYLDYGWDNYAGVTWANTPVGDDEKLFIGWMSNWRYAEKIPDYGFRRGVMTLPRKVSMVKRGNQYKLISSPVEQLEKLRKENQTVSEMNCDGEVKLDRLVENREGSFEMEIDINNKSSRNFGFKLSNALGEQFVFTCDVENKRIYIDRSKSGVTSFHDEFINQNSMEYLNFGNMKLRVFYDRTSVEVFINGDEVFTNLVFPNEVYKEFEVFSKGGSIELQRCEVWSLNPIWEP